jgi:hypothetical protein
MIARDQPAPLIVTVAPVTEAPAGLRTSPSTRDWQLGLGLGGWGTSVLLGRGVRVLVGLSGGWLPVAVAVGLGDVVAVGVAVGVLVAVEVAVGVLVLVAVGVSVGGPVWVGVGVRVSVAVGLGV